MAIKITTFPEIGEIPVSNEPTTTGFANQFVGDLYSNRGRFGGPVNFWEISEGRITAVGASTGTGFINHGKTAFENTQSGFILGVENGTGKFFIGNSPQYLNWTGSALNIAGSLTASEIHIPDQDTTLNSFHVQSDADTFWGTTETLFNTNNDNANAYVLKTGIAKFQSVTLSG